MIDEKNSEYPLIELDVPNAEYHARPGVSRSDLVHFARTPAHYIAAKDAPEKPSDAKVIGTLTHYALFQPDLFQSKVRSGPNVSRATKEWKTFEAECVEAGVHALKGADYDSICRMVDAVRQNKFFDFVMSTYGGIPEMSVWAEDEDTGVLVKARFDWVASNMILDLKTTPDASPTEFSKSVASFKYHWQAAHYLAVAEAAGMALDTFMFVVVEKTTPYGVACYELNQRDLKIATLERAALLKRFAECEAANNWPCYSAQPSVLELPRWAHGPIAAEAAEE